MKIAIPTFGNDIAPWFDVARHVAIYRLEGEQPILDEVFVCPSLHAVDRVRKINQEKVNVLVCSGISNKYKHMLQSGGVTVINHITGSVEQALIAFDNGELCGSDDEPIFQAIQPNRSLADLVEWTQKLFSDNGYEVVPGFEQASFPIDLVAERKCPKCGQPLRVAICCGMHAYRVDQEIREFHHAAGGIFDAEVYVHAVSLELERMCSDFGIQLMDPSEHRAAEVASGQASAFPLLEGPPEGHSDCFAGPNLPSNSHPIRSPSPGHTDQNINSTSKGDSMDISSSRHLR